MLDGGGSLFLMHGNMMALAVVRSKQITLRAFAWDFAVPTVSEMTVAGFGRRVFHNIQISISQRRFRSGFPAAESFCGRVEQAWMRAVLDREKPSRRLVCRWL